VGMAGLVADEGVGLCRGADEVVRLTGPEASIGIR